jgi:GNAT superfamily N-acetyltransferase
MAPVLPTLEEAVAAVSRGYSHQQQAQGGTRFNADPAIKTLHYAPGSPASAEYFFIHRGPEDALQVSEICPREQPHWLIVFTEDPQAALATYTSLGYVLSEREFLMVRAAAPVPAMDEKARVCQVTGMREVEAINAAYQGRVIYPVQLNDPQIRFYYAPGESGPLAWGGALFTSPGLVYVASMYTLPAYRFRGLGSAVLATLLEDAAADGATRSVLVSSPAGRRLYQRFGFLILADVLAFVSGLRE